MTLVPSDSAMLVDAREIHKSFGDLHVLRGVSLSVRQGEVVCLMGRSGSGKTTFLRCLNHLETPDSGTIKIDGELLGYRRAGETLRELSEREVARQRAKIGMVFQRFNLFPHRSVLENVILAPQLVRHIEKGEAEELGRTLLAQIGLLDKESEYPERLSGGQQQRVAIARALAMRPKLLLFDEPTSALDPELVAEVLEVMRSLATSHQVTMVVVTHEVEFARDVADRVVFMADGIVIEEGLPGSVIDTPRSEQAHTFFQKREARPGLKGEHGPLDSPRA